jgi:hypothetical protein
MFLTVLRIRSHIIFLSGAKAEARTTSKCKYFVISQGEGSELKPEPLLVTVPEPELHLYDPAPKPTTRRARCPQDVAFVTAAM